MSRLNAGGRPPREVDLRDRQYEDPGQVPRAKRLLSAEIRQWKQTSGEQLSLRKLAKRIAQASQSSVTFSALDTWIHGAAKPQRRPLRPCQFLTPRRS